LKTFRWHQLDLKVWLQRFSVYLKPLVPGTRPGTLDFRSSQPVREETTAAVDGAVTPKVLKEMNEIAKGGEDAAQRWVALRYRGLAPITEALRKSPEPFAA
jgi:hypothetical protein